MHALHRMVWKEGFPPTESVELYEDREDAKMALNRLAETVPSGAVVRRTDSELSFWSGNWEYWGRIEEMPVLESRRAPRMNFNEKESK